MIFGNGLGMSLDSNYFSLQNALDKVWGDSVYLSSTHKALIQSAIEGTTEKTPPKSEEQLDDLQLAIIAIEFLSEFEKDDISWVSDGAKELPSAFKKYVHSVAHYFHQSDHKLDDTFVSPLSDFIKKTMSHVATLNYDNLLYDSLQSTDVLTGYDGPLIDGFWARKGGFDPTHLDRNNVNEHGWYLHLHGSPLYVGNKKLVRHEKSFLNPTENCHIVLTHVQHKPSIIGFSHILSEYWLRLKRANQESKKIIFFGYSGKDGHLNETLNLQDKDIIVIESKRSGGESIREEFWKYTLDQDNINLIQLENILDFSDWDSL
ncbi:MAG: hypothetical protein HOG34_18845 [Bacteroidetes bacterium]|nr:hypothetical protein [Bacteroidota bacterium]